MNHQPESHEVIATLEAVSATWLTAVLKASGALLRGAVANFDVAGGHGNWSTNAGLRVHYTADAQGDKPGQLFLKIVNADLGDESFGPSEVLYYTRDYVDVPDAPLVRCYAGVYSAEKRRYHLLLDDLSATHVVAHTKTPTLAYGLALAEGLAAMHARWWGDGRLAAADAPRHTPAHIQRFVDIAQPGAPHILARFTTELQPHWPALIHELYAHHPAAIIARNEDGNGFTLIHGDANSSNILVPRDGDRPIYLIDRQPFDWSLTTWLGVYDLAYAMVLDWDVETRRQLERPVLAHYHAHLVQRGIQDYPWERLWDDYRLCVAMGVYIATEYCRGGINEPLIPIWLPMLQRALTACDDLDCRAQW